MIFFEIISCSVSENFEWKTEIFQILTTTLNVRKALSNNDCRIHKVLRILNNQGLAQRLRADSYCCGRRFYDRAFKHTVKQ